MKRPLYTEAKRAPDLDERPTLSVVVWIEGWPRLIVDADPALVALLDTPQPRSGTAASTLAYLRSVAAHHGISFFVHTPIFRRLQTSEGARHTDEMSKYQGRPGAALQIGATRRSGSAKEGL